MLPDWFHMNVPGYQDLTRQERDAIMYFTLLWSLFEARVLDTSASANSIELKIDSWHESGLLLSEEFEQFKNYFVQRYIDNGEPNNRFEHLHLRDGDKPDLVLAVLKGEETSLASVVTALLIVVLRFRNNYFHGIKWAYKFKDQLENFTTANNLLIKVIEINKHG